MTSADAYNETGATGDRQSLEVTTPNVKNRTLAPGYKAGANCEKGVFQDLARLNSGGQAVGNLLQENCHRISCWWVPHTEVTVVRTGYFHESFLLRW